MWLNVTPGRHHDMESDRYRVSLLSFRFKAQHPFLRNDRAANARHTETSPIHSRRCGSFTAGR